MSLSALLCGGGASAPSIPCPRIEIVKPTSRALSSLNPGGIDFFVVPDFTVPGTARKVPTAKMPMLIADNISDLLLSLDLRLEVLHYTSYKAYANKRSTRRGYHKPTHGTVSVFTSPAMWPVSELAYANPTGNTAPVVGRLAASKFNGGVPADWAYVSEYGVTSFGQRFLLDGMGSFFFWEKATFRRPGFPNPTYTAPGLPIPRGARRARDFPSDLSGVTRRLRNGYFQFRYSIVDPADPRRRLTGPHTTSMVIGPMSWPLLRNYEDSQWHQRAVNDPTVVSPIVLTCYWNSRVTHVS